MSSCQSVVRRWCGVSWLALTAPLFLVGGGIAGEIDDVGPVLALACESRPNDLLLDSSPNRNDGVASGATGLSSGRFGESIVFYGNPTQALISIGDHASLDLTTGLTLEAWVYPVDTQPTWSAIMVKETTGQAVYSLYANSPGNVPRAQFLIGGTVYSVQGTSTLPIRQWTHLAATYDGAIARFYVNGAQLDSRAISGSITTSGGALQLGGNRLFNNEHFDGRVDELRIYRRALSATEINTDMTTPIGAAVRDPALDGAFGDPFSVPHPPVHGALLPSGKFLFWSRNANYGNGETFVWDPANGQTTTLDAGTTNMFCSGQGQMADGRILIPGGHIDSWIGVDSARIFDPKTNTIQPVPDMAYDRWYPTVTMLPDGRLLTVSGTTTCRTCWAEVPEIFDPLTNSWTQLTTARRYIAFYPHQFVLPDGRVLVTSNQLEPGPTLALDVPSQSWQVIDGSVLEGGSAAPLSPTKFLKSGTSYTAGDPPVEATENAWLLDMSLPAPSWRSVAPMRFQRTQHSLTTLPDGTVLNVGGGRNSDVYDLDNAVRQAEIWNPATETWRTAATMAKPRVYHSIALLMLDGRVILTGGGGGVGVDQRSAEIYSPPYLYRGARPTLDAGPSIIRPGTPFQVATTSPGAQRVTLMRFGAITHAFNSDQRFLDLTVSPRPGGLDVTAPLNHNLAPPGYYMLFLLNGQNVPALAQVVRVPTAAETSLLGEASDPRGAGLPYKIAKVSGGFRLTWSAPPTGTATRYSLYSVALGRISAPVCERDLGTATSIVVPALPTDRGLVVVARDASGEGSYGRASNGAERAGAYGSARCP